MTQDSGLVVRMLGTVHRDTVPVLAQQSVASNFVLRPTSWRLPLGARRQLKQSDSKCKQRWTRVLSLSVHNAANQASRTLNVFTFDVIYV